MRTKWVFSQLGQKLTSSFGTHPADVQPGLYPQLFGVDGRYSGEVRRYPGNVRYPHVFGEAAIQGTAADYQLTLSQVEPFEVTSSSEVGEVIRGVVVKGVNASGVSRTEIWYNTLGTSKTYGNRQLLTSQYKGCVGTLTPGTTTWTLDDIGSLSLGTDSGPTTGFVEGGLLSPVLFDDGTTGGSVPYAAVEEITHIGARQVGNSLLGGGVVRRLGEVWHPVGKPAFNGQVLCLAIIGGKLYAGGSFTEYDGKECVGIAVWDGVSWSPVGFEPGVALTYRLPAGGAVTCICGSPFDGDTSTIYIGGLLEINDSGWKEAMVIRLVMDGDFRVAEQIATGVGTYIPTGGWANAIIVRGGQIYLTGASLACNSVVGYSHTIVQTAKTVGFANVVNTGLTEDLGEGYQLAVSGTTLYLASSTSIHSFNGTTWTALPATTLNPVSAVLVDSDGGIWTAGAWGTNPRVQKLVDGSWVNYDVSATFQVETPFVHLLDAGSTILVVGHFLPDAEPLYSTSTTISVSTRGKYLYLLASNGDHKTLWWDGSAFKVSRFGPQVTYLPRPWTPTFAGSGKVTAGQYQVAYRYRQVERGIYTALSKLSDPGTSTDSGVYMTSAHEITPAAGSLPPGTFPDSLNRLQVLQTISSLDPDYAAGGSLYVAAEGAFHVGDTVEGDFTVKLEYTGDYDQGEGHLGTSMDDASLVSDSTRLYNPWTEDVTELGITYASFVFGGVHFAVERLQGAVLLRWSPPSRLEPENFPAINEYWTRIRVTDIGTCRLVRVGNYLVLFGGDRVYRIQVVSGQVGVIELASDFKIISRNSFTVIGSKIYLITEVGLLVVDVVSGGYQIVDGFDRIFLRRWRGLMTSGVWGAYDAQMGCMYFHNPLLDETLCIWLSTGIISILVGSGFAALAQQADLGDTGIQRAYFLTNYRWLCSPNWNPIGTQTMTGITATPITSPNGTLGDYSGTIGTLNPVITSVTRSSSTSLSITIWGDWPVTTGFPDYLTGTYIAFGDVALGKITTSTAVTGGVTLTVSIDSSTTTPTVGSRIAIAPIIFCLVGSSLWAPTSYPPQTLRGVPDHNTRKQLDGGLAQISDVECNSADSTPFQKTIGSTGILVFGATRSPNERRTSGIQPLVDWEKYGTTTAGSALVEHRASANDATFRADGEILYPVLLSSVSNLAFSVVSWLVRGDFSGSEKAGQSQNPVVE